MTCACTETSSADTGSSQTISFGCTASARAMPRRWRWPPENSYGILDHLVGPQPDALRTAAPRARAPAAPAQALEVAQRLGDDVGGAHARVERRVRILEHHLQLAPHRAHLRRRQRLDRRPRQSDLRRRSGPAAAGSACRWSTCRSPIRRPGPASRRCAMEKLTPSTACTLAPPRPKQACCGGEVLAQVAALRAATSLPVGACGGAAHAAASDLARRAPARRPDASRRPRAPARAVRAAARRASSARSRWGSAARTGSPAPASFSDGHHAGDLDQAPPALVAPIAEVRHRRRAGRACTDGAAREQRLDRRLLDLAARIHHDDALRDLGDHAEVVRDQDDRRAGLRAAARASARGSAPGW